MIRAWRELPQERRLAAMAGVGLFLTLFLPWYQETVFANGVTSLRSASSSLTGWGAFSFVEAAVLLVAAAVLILLFVRAEGQAFHVPGGDGGVITAAGFWTCVLIVWRIFDKEGTSRHDQIAYTSGIEWGIFVALGVAAVLTYAGTQIGLAHEPEPPLPGETVVQRSRGRTRRRGWLRKGSDDTRRPASTRRAYPGPDMGADDDWTQEVRARRAMRRRPRPPRVMTPPRRRHVMTAPRPPRVMTPPRRRHVMTAPRPPRVMTAPRRRPSACAPGASPPPTSLMRRAAPCRPGAARSTGVRSRSSTSPSRRPPGWAAAAATPPQDEDAEPEPRSEGTRSPPPDPSDDQLTIRLDRPDEEGGLSVT